MDNSKSVLVIDDASLVRLYYRSILEGAGYRVEEALNGLEALEKLLSISVDLLIVDINMPQMDGLTFLKLLRQKARPVCCVPALVTSTESKAVDFAAARQAGANCYLVKPIEREALLEYAGMLSGLPP
jgi:two-component system chemotaxis response regulator CheY